VWTTYRLSWHSEVSKIIHILFTNFSKVILHQIILGKSLCCDSAQQWLLVGTHVCPRLVPHKSFNYCFATGGETHWLSIWMSEKRPSKRAKLAFTRDYELQTEAVVRHVATTTTGSVLAHSERIPVPASPEKLAPSTHASVPPIPNPYFSQDFSQNDHDDQNSLGTVHFLSAPAPQRRYANSVSLSYTPLCLAHTQSQIRTNH
jgi:hypothetical protein